MAKVDRLRERLRIERTLGAYYSKIKGDRCVYCNVKSEVLDHVPPVSVAINMTHEELENTECFLAPSCEHCNWALNNHPAKTIKERRDVIRVRIRDNPKNRKILNMAVTREDLDEFSGSTYEYMRESLSLKTFLERKIDVLYHLNRTQARSGEFKI